LISFREGRFQQAIELSRRFDDSPKDIPCAIMLICRSMAQYQLHDCDGAMQSLEQAESIMPTILRILGTSQQRNCDVVDGNMLDHDWLIAEILRREAAGLIRQP
jgi:hypothetical protein